MATSQLRDVQDRLRALIADPATLAGPLSELEERVAALPIRGDARLSAAERVRIYAGMYAVRMRDALVHDCPALRAALGEEGFDDLARRYVLSYPSDRPSLRDLGRHLPGFLAHHHDRRPSWLAELAQLEWALVEAFDALDQPLLDRPRLAALAAEEWPALLVEPVRSLRLLACTAPVDSVRERLLAQQPAGDVPAESVLLRVWRQDLVVYVRRVAVPEMAALRWLWHGATFAELCDWLAERAAPGEDVTPTAARLLESWIDDGLLVAH